MTVQNKNQGCKPPFVNMTPEEKTGKISSLVDMVNMSEISSIKNTLNSILRVICDSNTTVKELKDIIQVDPPLAAKVLKTANSAYYSRSFSRVFADIEQAIIWMGFETIKELALSQKVCEIFDKDKAINGYSRKTLWRHSVAVAMTAKAVCRKEFGEKGENAYAAGLLHDFGIIAEDQFLRDEFRAVLHYSRDCNVDLATAETRCFGYNHAEIGEQIARSWGLPPELAASIGGHYEPEKQSKETLRCAAVQYVSDYICQENEFAYGAAPIHDTKKFDKCLKIMDVKPAAMGLIFQDVREKVKEMEDKGIW